MPKDVFEITSATPLVSSKTDPFFHLEDGYKFITTVDPNAALSTEQLNKDLARAVTVSIDGSIVHDTQMLTEHSNKIKEKKKEISSYRKEIQDKKKILNELKDTFFNKAKRSRLETEISDIETKLAKAQKECSDAENKKEGIVNAIENEKEKVATNFIQIGNNATADQISNIQKVVSNLHQGVSADTLKFVSKNYRFGDSLDNPFFNIKQEMSEISYAKEKNNFTMIYKVHSYSVTDVGGTPQYAVNSAGVVEQFGEDIKTEEELHDLGYLPICTISTIARVDNSTGTPQVTFRVEVESNHPHLKYTGLPQAVLQKPPEPQNPDPIMLANQLQSFQQTFTLEPVKKEGENASPLIFRAANAPNSKLKQQNSKKQTLQEIKPELQKIVSQKKDWKILADNNDKILTIKNKKNQKEIAVSKDDDFINYQFKGAVDADMAGIVLQHSKEEEWILLSTTLRDIEAILESATKEHKSITLDPITILFLKTQPHADLSNIAQQTLQDGEYRPQERALPSRKI
jgi:hypothetical protein